VSRRFYRLAALPPGDRILEIGCATSKATLPLARRGFGVTCIELGPDLARAARANLAGYDVSVVEGSFESRRPPVAARFGLVFAATAGTSHGQAGRGASGGDERVRLRFFVQRFRRQVDAIRPRDGSSLSVDRDLSEVSGIVQWCQDTSPLLRGEVDVSRGAVREQQTEHPVADHGYSCDCRQVVLAHVLILCQRLDTEHGLISPGKLPVRQKLIPPEHGPLSD
jgi:hypothetical protein